MKQTAFLAYKNVVKKPVRSGILVFCVALLAALQVGVALIDQSTERSLEKGLSRLGADLMIVPKTSDVSLIKAYTTGTPATFYMPAGYMDRLKTFPFVGKVSPQLYIKSLSNASCCAVWNVFLIGFDPRTDFTVTPWLGRETTALGPDDVLCGAGIQAVPGSTLRFYGQPFRVAGVLEPGGMGLDFSVFIPMDAAHTMIAESNIKAEKPLDIPKDQVSALLIKLKDEKDGGLPLWKAAYEIEMAVPEVSVVRSVDISIRVKKNLTRVMVMTTSVSLFIWMMCALLIALVFGMSITERQQEIGLLHAMGATRRHIFTMIETEALMITLAGSVAGALFALGGITLFSTLIAHVLDIPALIILYQDSARIMGQAIGTAALIGGAAAFVPAVRAISIEPYEAIRRTL